MCVDFDGVINDYSGGWKGPYIFGEPIEGAFEFLGELLARSYDVVIFTVRAEWPQMDRAIRDWMILNGFAENDALRLRITNVKPAAKLYIDDRNFLFEGTFPSMKYIKMFEPWHKEDK